MRENLEDSKCKQCFLLPFGFNCHCSWQKWAKWAKGISYWELRPVETHLDSFVLSLIYGEPPGLSGPQWATYRAHSVWPWLWGAGAGSGGLATPGTRTRWTSPAAPPPRTGGTPLQSHTLVGALKFWPSGHMCTQCSIWGSLPTNNVLKNALILKVRVGAFWNEC